MSELSKKEAAAIKLIQLHSTGEPLEVAYSGGKDSDVILRLVQKSGVPYRAIYKNTTIDPPGTIKHCKDNGVEILQPQKTFYKLVEERGVPNRFRRFCCSFLKEYKVLDTAVLGIRAEESKARAKRYTEPTQCRVFTTTKRVQQVMPILFWTADDVKEYIEVEKIKLHPLYYNEDGSVDVTRRLGCIGCPLASKRKIVNDYKKYPKHLKAITKAVAKHCESHREAHKIYEDHYKLLFMYIFCDSKCAKLIKYEQTLFGETDYKSELERVFNMEL